jgi:hypothetical protein
VRKTPLVTPGMYRRGRRFYYTISKVCTRCNVVKDVTDFHVMPSKNHTHAPYCKSCSNEVRKLWERERVRRRRVESYDLARRKIIAGGTVPLTGLEPAVRTVLLRNLLRAGMTPKVIARKLQCHVDTVYKYAHKDEEIRRDQLA